ncbi:MAG: D-hexose-6-phosphate mutarotase [Candidatus Acidiferrales bacterium]
MGSSIAQLDRRFEIPGIAQVVEGNGGLPKVQITSVEAAGEMYLHGAQVTSWKPAAGQEVFFLSSLSRWIEGQAIRGGVPICFPWFGGKKDDPKAPAHGFVRTKAWQLESIAQAGAAVTVSMFTESSESTKKWWPGEFRLVHRVTFGAELSLELLVMNTGRTSLPFEEALHAYYRVGNVEKVRVWGLDRVHYFDKTDSNREKLQDGEITVVSEIDRVYLNTRDEIGLEDSLLHRRTRITKENSRTTVVWNPWVQKAHSLSDFADDEWRQMICIETSNVADFAVDLAPDQQHKMKAVMRVSDL